VTLRARGLSAFARRSVRVVGASVVVGGLFCAVGVTTAGPNHEAGLPVLDFEPPAPGTYSLHRIMAAPDGEVLGLDGRPERLRRFTRERITLLGFIYTTCVDPDGCPRAYRVFETVRETVAAEPALRERVRLVTLSFDPARDTPETMRRYAGSRARAGDVPWLFLTTRSARELAPLLEGFGQDVRYTANGGRRELSHVLKVFLIDRAGFVREIYSSDFLHPRMLRNDVETLVLEERGR
jgi:cytochrome oxidase Cu insertion factor (SCO1/SenC/PrrC family)